MITSEARASKACYSCTSCVVISIVCLIHVQQKRTGGTSWRVLACLPHVAHAKVELSWLAILPGLLSRSAVRTLLAGWPVVDMRCRSSQTLSTIAIEHPSSQLSLHSRTKRPHVVFDKYSSLYQARTMVWGFDPACLYRTI